MHLIGPARSTRIAILSAVIARFGITAHPPPATHTRPSANVDPAEESLYGHDLHGEYR